VLFSLLFAAFLLALGLGLLVWHARSWRAAQAKALNDLERKFADRQFHRRTQVSLLIAVVGGMVAGAEWIVSPVANLVYWLVVLLVVLWILALAAADAFATQQHFSAQQGAHDAELLLLAREIRVHAKDSLVDRSTAPHDRNGHPPEDEAAK
jgi:cell division protein FtsW (lipid II flippase)